MKNKKTLVIILFIFIILIGSTLGYLYFYTDIFKSNKALFFDYLGKVKFVNNDFVEKYKSFIDIENNSNYSSNGNIEILNSSEINDTNISNVQQMFLIKYNTLKNKNLKQDYADFTLNIDNEDITTLRYLRDNNTFGIKMENVLKKYIAVENSNLKEFLSKFDIDTANIPDSIQKESVEELLKIDENQLNYIKETYGKIIYDNINGKDFTKTKNSNNTTITLSISEREFANIIVLELNKLKNDDAVINVLIQKLKIYGYNYNLDSFKTAIQEQIDNINDNQDITDNKFLTISISKNKTNITNFQILFNIKNDETKDYDEYKYVFDLSENNKLVIFAKDSSNNYRTEISYGFETNSVSVNIDIYNIDSKNNIIGTLGKMQYQINNYSENIINQLLSLTYYSKDNNSKTQININDSKTLKQDIQIEKLTDENMELLNNKSKEELLQLYQGIINRIYYVYGDEMLKFTTNNY